MFSLLDRYIAQRVVIATGLVLGVLLALTVFFAFLDGLRDYGQANFGLYELVRYILLSQPRKLYEVFPVATLIGALLGLSALAVNAELVAMRAAGVSVAQIVGAAMKVGVVFAVIAATLGEYVVPIAENRAQLGRAQALARGMVQQRTGIWLRDHNNFINIGEVLPDLSLLRVNVYSFEDDIRLRVQTRAERAVYSPAGWQLENIRESHVDETGIQARRAGTQPWSTTLTQDVIGVFAVRPEQLSIQQLVTYIEHLQRNGQSTERYRLVLWQKLLMPLAVAVMVLLATPFAFGHARAGGLSQRIFAGVVLGLAFVVVGRSFGHVGLIYGLPPFLGATLPIVLFLIGALFLLRRSV
jgi:lipopolysaccharide export system permease protein